MMHPKKRRGINVNRDSDSCDLQPGPAIASDGNDDMETSSDSDSEKHDPKICLVNIQISINPRSPNARLNGPEATHQAVFEDLNWIPKILVTEDESGLNGRKGQKVVEQRQRQRGTDKRQKKKQ